MADLRDHMADDLATALADKDGAAVDIYLDGVGLRAFVEDVEFQDNAFEGVVLARKRLTLLYGSIDDLVPTQEVDYNGIRFTVDSFLAPFPALEIILTRFGS